MTDPIDRRGLMVGGLVTGFTLATESVLAQAIHTDAAGLDVGPAEIPTDKGNLPAYFARPAGAGPFPVIVVIEEIFGVHEYMQDVCRRFAHAGYLAVAPELYARIGKLSEKGNAAEIFRDVINKAPDAQILSDLDSTIAWAEANKGDRARVGVNGFCRGGRDVWLLAAHSPALKAAVSWYGQLGGQTTPIQPRTAGEVAGELKCPLLGLYAGKDPATTPAMLKAAEAAAHAAGKNVEIVIYPDAQHGFHADYRPSYNAADATDGWNRTLAWFKKYLVA